MSQPIAETEARLALSSIERQRQQVMAEVDVPWWYWVGLAAGWIGLGALANHGPAWATIAGTVAFGAGHASVAPWVLSGRHGSSHLSVRSDLVGRHIPLVVVGFLMVMTVVTIALALVANADGDRNPALLASVVIAALVLRADHYLWRRCDDRPYDASMPYDGRPIRRAHPSEHPLVHRRHPGRDRLGGLLVRTRSARFVRLSALQAVLRFGGGRIHHDRASSDQ